MAETPLEFAVFTIYRDEDDVESLKVTCLHTDRVIPKRDAHDLAASYLMSLMAGEWGAVVREVSQRPVAWQARYPDEPSKDEIVVLLRPDVDTGFSFTDLWVEVTATA